MKFENIENSSESAAVLADDIHNDSGTQSNNETITASAAKSSTFNGVEDIRATLGDHAVLLSIPSGEKGPKIKGWPQFTKERMHDSAYLAALQDGNVGVLLGPSSNHLCAIDIDHDGKLEPFLEANPILRTTLITRGSKGAQIWVQCADGNYPQSTPIKTVDGLAWGEWRAQGNQSVIHGIHPLGHRYQCLNKVSPISLKFEAIIWPDELLLAWEKTAYDEIVEVEGEPFITIPNGGDVINHAFFVAKYMRERRVCYDGGFGEFFEYCCTSGLWEVVTKETIKRSFLNDLRDVANETNRPRLHFKRKDGLANELLALLKSQAEQLQAFGLREEAIHVKNGMICFEGDEVLMKGFHPDYYSRNCCSFAFDPDADCPRFKAELLGSALVPDDIDLVQKWAGSLLLARNQAQRFMILVGTSGGGKSTLMNIFERVIGLNNVAQMRTEHLGDRFELYGFVGKSLLVGKDVAADFLMHKNAHIIKGLVGHDFMEAEKKGHNQRVQIRGDFNLGITCNADLLIKLQGDVAAWRRRLLVVRYENPPPPKKIPDFAERLLADEGPGILKWMVEGAIALVDDLRLTGDYQLADAQKAAIEDILAQSDSIRHFVASRIIKDSTADVTVEELRGPYYDFCESRGWTPMPINQFSKELVQRLLELFQVALRKDIERGLKAQRGFKGIRLAGGDD